MEDVMQKLERTRKETKKKFKEDRDKWRGSVAE